MPDTSERKYTFDSAPRAGSVSRMYSGSRAANGSFAVFSPVTPSTSAAAIVSLAAAVTIRVAPFALSTAWASTPSSADEPSPFWSSAPTVNIYPRDGLPQPIRCRA